MFQDIENTLGTDRDSAGLPCMAIKNGEFQQISSYKKQKLKKFSKNSAKCHHLTFGYTIFRNMRMIEIFGICFFGTAPPP